MAEGAGQTRERFSTPRRQEAKARQGRQGAAPTVAFPGGSGIVAWPQEVRMPVPATPVDLTARAVVDASLAVHRTLGPGLLESVYEHCLAHELVSRGIPVQRQTLLPVTYRDIRVDAGFRTDLIVDECVIVEIKSVEKLLPVHEAQLLTYLKLTRHQVGLLINFNVALLKQGLRRLIRTP
jgi:GxxExxY protein